MRIEVEVEIEAGVEVEDVEVDVKGTEPRSQRARFKLVLQGGRYWLN